MLVACWVAVGVCVIGNWIARIGGNQRLEEITKPAATIAIAVLALTVSDGEPTAAVLAGMIGFAFCLIGDVALLPRIDRFIVGLGAFLIGHIAFIAMFIALGLDRWRISGIAIGLLAAVSPFVGRRVILGAAAQSAGLKAPVTAYFIVIMLMTAAGWSTGRLAAVIGTTMFVISDSILGWRAFVAPKKWMPLAVMVTYHAALLGLAITLA